MMRIRWQTKRRYFPRAWLTLVLITIFYVTTVQADTGRLDPVAAHLARSYEMPLFWDNVETDSKILFGPAPRKSKLNGLHTIRFSPGDSLVLQVPEKRMVRLQAPEKNARLERLEIGISGGTGLVAFPVIPKGRNGCSALVDPDTDDPWLLYLHLPKNPGTELHADLDVALFISRQGPVPDLLPRRSELCPTGDPVRVHHHTRSDTLTFRRWPENCPQQLNVEGPAFIALETRYLYPERETARRTGYFITVMMDQKPFVTMDLNTLPESSDRLTVGKIPLVCGRIRTAFLSVPQGNHTLSFTPRAALLARITTHDVPDYLFPGLNGPKGYDRISELRAQNRFHPAIPHAIDIEADAWEGNLLNKAAAARRIARDNIHAQGGLVGPAILEKIATLWPASPEIKTAADELYTNHSFFRSLVPSSPVPAEKSRWRWFIPNHLHRETDGPVWVADQHKERLKDMIGSACFTDIPSSDTHPLVFDLPERAVPSRLRILVNAPGKEPGDLFVQFDDGDPLRLSITPLTDLSANAFRITLADIGLVLSNQGHSTLKTPEGSPWDAAFPSPLFSQVTRPSWHETLLPREVKQITVWKENSALFEAALQFRDARTWNLSEIPYMTALALMTPPSHQDSESAVMGTFARLLENGIQAGGSGWSRCHPPGSPTDLETIQPLLEQHWVPLVRKLRSAHDLFRTGVNLYTTETPVPERFRESADRLLLRARKLEDENAQIPALEQWAKIYHTTRGTLHHDAAFAIARLLLDLGEPYLSEMMLRQLYLTGDTVVRQKAFEKLDMLYQQQENSNRRFNLYSHLAVTQPCPDHLAPLVHLLFEEGDRKNALMLATILPRSHQPIYLLMKSALDQGWYQLLENRIQTLTCPQEKAWWRAQSLLSQNRPYLAMPYLAEAGSQAESILALME